MNNNLAERLLIDDGHSLNGPDSNHNHVSTFGIENQNRYDDYPSIEMDAIKRKIESDPEPKIFEWYMKFQLTRFGPFFFVGLWLCVLLLGVFYGFDILNLTVFSFAAPAGTPGYHADARMKQQFPIQINERQLLLYYDCKDCNVKKNQTIYTVMTDCNGTTESLLFCMSAHFEKWLETEDVFLSYTDVRTTSMEDPQDPYIAALAQHIYVASSHKSAIGIIYYDNKKSQTAKNDFIDAVDDECNKINKNFGKAKKPYITVKMTGETALIKDMNEESRKDVESKDTLTIPLALCVLAFIIRSWRLMFIPLVCFGVSICASFSIMRPFAEHVLDVNPFCPSIMMSVTIAMSIDYSLFLLSRFREEVERTVPGKDKEGTIKCVRDAVRQTTRWSGKVIALSGCILSITYFALIAYPMEILQSVGLGAGLAIVCTILVNLTLTPSILLIFPYFFSKFGWEGCPFHKKKIDPDGYNDPLVVNDSANGIVPLNVNSRISDISSEQNINDIDPHREVKENGEACEKFWYHCGSRTTVCPWSVLIMLVVYAAICPIGWQFTTFEKQLADTLIFPRDSAHLTTYNHVVDDFSAGYVAPWYILIYTKKGQKNVWDHDYLDETGLMMDAFWQKCIKNDYNVTIDGLAFFGTYSEFVPGIPSARALNWSQIATIEANPLYKPVYDLATNSKISNTTESSYYGMTSSFDPYYKNAINFVEDARDYLDDVCNKYDYDCYLSGGSVDEVDSVNKIYGNFATVLGSIVAVIFGLMGFVFKSVFVPFRLFITIALPMTFVYGLAVMTYQHGLLSGLNVDSLANTDGLYWIIPVMTVTILIGLALDYDIFLFARIYEYRVMGGVPTQQAILRGVYKTGAIITAAGLIMGIAFCGLLLSKITSLNQTGFIMVIAVLVDTFIIRTSLVPAVLSIAREVNWWPGLNPRCTTDEDANVSSEIRLEHSINNPAALKNSQQYNESTLDDTM